MPESKLKNLTSVVVAMTGVGTLVMSFVTFYAAQNAAKQAKAAQEKASAAERAAAAARDAVAKTRDIATVLSMAEESISKLSLRGEDFARNCHIAVAYGEIEREYSNSEHILGILNLMMGKAQESAEVLNCAGLVDASPDKRDPSNPESHPENNLDAENEFSTRLITVATYQLENCDIAKSAHGAFVRNQSTYFSQFAASFDVAVSEKYARVVLNAEGDEGFARDDLIAVQEIGEAAKDSLGKAPDRFKRENLQFANGAYLLEAEGLKNATNSAACVRGAQFSDFE